MNIIIIRSSPNNNICSYLFVMPKWPASYILLRYIIPLQEIIVRICFMLCSACMLTAQRPVAAPACLKSRPSVCFNIYHTAFPTAGITRKQICCTAVSTCRYILVRLKFLHHCHWSAPLFHHFTPPLTIHTLHTLR